MGRLTFYAGIQKHFADFEAPLWLAMPEELRGDFYARGNAYNRATELGIPAIGGRPKKSMNPVVVASYEDYHAVRPAPVILIGHGAGQTYNGCPNDQLAYRHQSYSGGRNRERIVLNICPSESDAQLNRDWWPDALSVACGPYRLDPWLRGERETHRDEELVVLSFHLDASVCPETHWAFPAYQQAIKALAESNQFNLAGHGHPRAQHMLQPFWEECGIPFIANLEEVFDRASVYVCDNSSSQLETAALGIPNVVLNQPSYRRHVNHGLRFWSSIPGREVDSPECLALAIEQTLAWPTYLKQKREDAVRVAYGDGRGGVLTDGRATGRAVEALIRFAESMSS